MNAAPRILVTGFRAFAGHAANPSEKLASALAAADWGGGVVVRAAVFDVAYTGVAGQFDAAVRTVRPHAVLAFGLDYATDVVKLERLAVNLDEAAIPDEAGEHRRGVRIEAKGPAARWATLPLDSMHAAVAADGIPVKFSAHAGTFLCNHLLYHALGRARRRGGYAVGFVHLPPEPELLKAEDRGRRTGMPFASLFVAGRALVRVLRDSLGRGN